MAYGNIFHDSNVSAVNVRVLYQLTPNKKEIKRYEYIKEFGISFCQTLIQLRVSNPKVSYKLREMEIFLKLITNVPLNL